MRIIITDVTPNITLNTNTNILKAWRLPLRAYGAHHPERVMRNALADILSAMVADETREDERREGEDKYPYYYPY